MANKKTGGTPAKKGRAKSAAQKKSATGAKPGVAGQKSEKERVVNNKLLSVLLMALALLILFISLNPSGAGIWKKSHDLLNNLFGFGCVVWSLMLLLISTAVALDRSVTNQVPRLAGAAIFTLLLGALFHILGNKESYLLKTGILEQAKAAWGNPGIAFSGGFFGSLAGAILSKMGKAPAVFLAILVMIVLLMLLTGTTHVIWFRFLSRNVRRAKISIDERFETHAQRQEERDILREERETEREALRATLQKEREAALQKKKTFNPPGLPLDLPPEEEPQVTDSEPPFEPTLDAFPVDIPPRQQPFAQEPPLRPEVTIPEVLEDAAKPEASRKKRGAKADMPEDDNKIQDDSADIFSTSASPFMESSPVYRLPPVSLLSPVTAAALPASGNVQADLTGQKLIETLNSFNVSAEILAISRGPSVTRYELEPKAGVRISRITQLADDIALRLAASGVRIEAPIPNKSAIGIEVPNKQKSMVGMREIIDSDIYRGAKSKLTVALGKDITGNIITADLAKMPHMLIAGTTGSGKSVCMNTMIVSILYNATPDEIKLIMIDPKQVEFTVYNGIAHLLMPVVADPRKAAGALSMAVSEMSKRYKAFSELGVRDITGYNKLAQRDPQLRPLEKIVIFIDELSDLMMVSPGEVEDSICRLAQMARAAGMHLVIATQRPSVDVITGIIKANIPSRIALSVSSQIDSRTILDTAGAEKLLGYGDMLYNPLGIPKPLRVQGCFISDQEVESVVSFIKDQASADYDQEKIEEMERNAAAMGQKKKGGAAAQSDEENGERDEMYTEAVRVVVEAEMASTTLLQRKLKLGYARASRIMDELEGGGVVGPFEGAKPRKVLITKTQFLEMQALGDDDYGAAAQRQEDSFEDEDAQ